MTSCPSCRSPLRERETSIGSVPGCDACAHAWVSEDVLVEFQQTVSRAFTPDDLVRLQADIKARQRAAMDRPVAYHSCPGCERDLLRRTFGANTFLLVHYCVEHGYWIQDDDVAGIVDFVTHGGELLELQYRLDRVQASEQHLKIQNRALEDRAASFGGVVPVILPM